MNAKWIAYFFVIGTVFKMGDCFPSDSSYKYNHLLYPNREEANRMQFKQMQLENEIRVRIINERRGKQQIEVNGVIWQEKASTKSRYRNTSSVEGIENAEMYKVLKQVGENEFLLELSSAAYKKETILATISKFSNKCDIYLGKTVAENFILHFKQKENKREDLKQLVENFCIELEE